MRRTLHRARLGMIATAIVVGGAATLVADEAAEQLWTLARQGDLEGIQRLVEQGVDIDAKTPYGVTALSFASSRGHTAVVRALVEAGAEVNTEDSFYGFSPLDMAVMEKHVPVIRLLIAHGASNVDGAFLAMVRGNNVDLVREILATGRVGDDAVRTAQSFAKEGKLSELLAGLDVPPPPDEAPIDPDSPARTPDQEHESTDAPTASAEQRKQYAAEDLHDSSVNWPQFRGTGARGVADGQRPPVKWDVTKGRNLKWRTTIPGLGHSCPVIWDDRIYITTAVSENEADELRTGLYGDVDSVDDSSQHEFRVICVDKNTGQILWQRLAHKGVPAVKRHLKSTHANSTVATDGKHVIAFFASEGLYCYDTEGELKWSRQFGTLDSGWFYDPDYQWGFGSSPVIYRNLVLVQCDIQDGSFLAALDIHTGETVWKVPRQEVPTWSTPTVGETPDGPLVITNGTRFVRGYDAESGDLKWQLGGNSEIVVPTPFVARQLIFVASGYRPVQPIHAIRLLARGDLTKADKAGNDQLPAFSDSLAAEGLAWSHARGGPYMPTPIVYREYLYTCSNAGVVTCYHATTGAQVKRRRLGGGGRKSFVASPVAGDGHLYLTSEEGEVYVLPAGADLDTAHVNSLGEPCLATPAISEGVMYFRTKGHLIAVDQSLSVEQLQALEAQDEPSSRPAASVEE